MAEPSPQRARELLERVSNVVEARPDADARTIRNRAGVSRQAGERALELLLQAGFVERREVNAEWHYRSVKPYRAADFAPRAGFSATHSAGQGGAG